MRRAALLIALLLAACDGGPSLPPRPPSQPPDTRPPAPWPTTLTDRRDGFIAFTRVTVDVYRHGITLFKSGKFYDWTDGFRTFRDCDACIGYGSYEIRDTTIVLRFEFMDQLTADDSLPGAIVGSIRGDTLRIAFPERMWGVRDVYMNNGPYTLTERYNFP